MSRCQEPVGAPIARIAKQLNELETIIFRELWVGVRNPEGVWDWLVKKRRELKSLGMPRANREMFNYLREEIIVKSHKLSGVIERHCLPVEFITQLEESDTDQLQDYFGKFIRRIDEYLNTDAIGEQFGKADVYDNAKLNLASSARIPGSRGKGNARDERGK